MTSPSPGTLRSRYVAQAASDLEENRRRQQELAEKIKVLKQEEALLVDIMALAEGYEAPSRPSPLPERTQEEAALTPVRSAADATSAKTGTASRRTAPTEATGRGAGVRAARSTLRTIAKGKPRQPLLGDLLSDLLSAYDEPRPAKELRDELLEKHPDRTPTPQVVRNTLESLVAKGRVRRHKQKRSVMYSLVEPAAKTTGTTRPGTTATAG